jgi:hypothetical protein
LRIVCDIEANGLNPDRIHVIVCKDVDTGKVYVFKDLDGVGKADFLRFATGITLWVGHNFLGFDARVLNGLLSVGIQWDNVVDTFVVSRTVDATRDRHSLESWGATLGRPKLHTDITDWSVLTPEMEERCIGDVETNYLLYKHFERFIDSPLWKDALRTEHYTHYLSQILHSNGFAFDTKEASLLKDTIERELEGIIKGLKESFLPKATLVREVLPKETKFGTIAKNSIPKILGSDLSAYTAGAPFSLIEYVEFNPRSHKQRLDRLWDAGWSPVNKTDTHKDTQKALQQLKRKTRRGSTGTPEKTHLEASLGEYGVSGFGRYGWKTDEENLSTLPDTAPASAKGLVRFMLLSNRISTLNSWLEAVGDDGRIHGSFNHIGAWTHRMSHDRPNMGNIPKFNEKRPETTPYSDKMRALWVAGRDRYLVGVDAESIQLRVFAHYINDPAFTFAVTSGKKEDGTDPHSLNQEALGVVCKSRDDAKTFIYAWLLGAGIEKIAAILGCSKSEAQTANDNFLEFYPGLRYLKEKVIPEDAHRGYFKGFDGRYVRIWGDDVDSRRHFALAGYLQAGEAIIMKRAAEIWYPKLTAEKVPFWFVNFVHDEFQTETIRDLEVAEYVARTQADAIRQVGVDLKLRCPMAGSVLNGHGKLAIGDNWMETH